MEEKGWVTCWDAEKSCTSAEPALGELAPRMKLPWLKIAKNPFKFFLNIRKISQA
jgi:hypothetical protein